MNNKGIALLRFGTITEINESEGLAKVYFDEDDVTSSFLPIVKSGFETNIPLKSNVQCVCIMDENLENGAIVGLLFRLSNLAEKQYGTAFENGSKLYYNSQTNKYKFANNTENLKALFSDLLDAILATTHQVTAVGAPTGTPLNFVQFQQLKLRFENLFE